MPDDLKLSIRPASGKWSVRAGGAVLVESTRALAVMEPGEAPIIFFPREDVAMAFLDPSDTIGTSAHLGAAQYLSIVTKSRTIDDAALSYEAPSTGAEELAGYIAFVESDEVRVQEI